MAGLLGPELRNAGVGSRNRFLSLGGGCRRRVGPDLLDVSAEVGAGKHGAEWACSSGEGWALQSILTPSDYLR